MAKAQPKGSKLTADGQILELQRLSPRATAWLLSVRSARTLKENIELSGLRQSDDTFNARQVLEYATTLRRRRTDRAGDKDRMGHGDDGFEGGSLARKRELESKRLELQLLEAHKRVVSTDHVRDFLILVASRLKELGQTLQAAYGRDALALLNEAVSDMEATVGRWEKSLVEEEITI